MITRLAALLLVTATPLASASPTPPTIEDLKTYALDPSGKMVPYDQELFGADVVLAVKVSGAEGASMPLVFTATEDNSAAYSEAGRKAPPPRAAKFQVTVTLGRAHWVLLPIKVACYTNSKVTLGKSTKEISFPGSCPA